MHIVVLSIPFPTQLLHKQEIPSFHSVLLMSKYTFSINKSLHLPKFVWHIWTCTMYILRTCRLMDMWKLFWHLQILRTAEHWEMSLGIGTIDIVCTQFFGYFGPPLPPCTHVARISATPLLSMHSALDPPPHTKTYLRAGINKIEKIVKLPCMSWTTNSNRRDFFKFMQWCTFKTKVTKLIEYCSCSGNSGVWI